MSAKQLGFFSSNERTEAIPGRWTCGSFDVQGLKTWLLTLGFGLSLVASAQAAGPKAEIARVGDTTHLEFSGLSQWSYEMKRLAPNKFRLQVPALDSATVAQLNTWSDVLISQVQVDTAGNDGTHLITFTIADPKVENFDYLTDDPSRLIIDFYKPANDETKIQTAGLAPEGAVQVTKPRRLKKLPTKKVVTDVDGYQKQNRKPAGDERLEVPGPKPQLAQEPLVKGIAYDATDPEFNRLRIRDYEINEDAIIASRKNIYIQFPMLKLVIPIMADLLANLPEFVIVPRDDIENKEARLLLSLYQRQVGKTDRTQDRIGAFLKVYDHFQVTYPQSEYDEMIKNMAAHIYFLRYKRSGDPVDYDQSHSLYKYLQAKYPESPLAERIQQWIAFSELERKNGLATIQEIQEYLRRYPKSEIQDQAHLALAEGHLILNKFEDALKIYEELAQSGVQPRFRVESVYRQGDVAFAKRDWAAAEKAYRQAFTKFPQHITSFPNASYNLAEVLFWQGKYKDSLGAYIDFLSRFPDHAYGGYAFTRAGELLEAMGADRSRVIGAFLESYFRYRSNPGSEVARIRMLSQQMKGMNEKELKKAIEEITEIYKHSPLPTIDEFAKLMMADGYQRRGENEEALKELVSHYQAHPTSGNLHLFKTRILRNISEGLETRVGRHEFLPALEYQAKFAKTWLKNSDRMDVPFAVGRAYEQAGAFSEAARVYQDVLTQRLKVTGTPEEKERRINELLPSVESLRLRLAAVAAENRQYPEAYRELESLKDVSKLTAAENSERILLLARVHREKGELGQAKTQLMDFISQWKGEPAQVVANILELAQLQLKTNEFSESERQIDQILNFRKTGVKISDDEIAQALEIKGRALQAQKKDLAAVETYQQLLDDFEAQRPLGSIRYQVGDILFKRGDLGGAEKIWQKLDGEKYAVLKRLADERLENARWQSDHRRYLKRIPAMSGLKEE